MEANQPHNILLPEQPLDINGQVIQAIGITLDALNNSIRDQGITETVPTYNGDPSKCREWLSEIDKFCTLRELAEGKKIKTAYAAARGPVSRFIERLITSEPDINWSRLSTNILAHFSVVTDSDHAHDLLRKIKQAPGEPVALYAERIHSLSKDAFTEEELTEPAANRVAQRQLVNYFCDGLTDSAVQMKIIRRNPTTMKAAYDIARDEFALMKRFQLRGGKVSRHHRGFEDRTIEQMEVDQVRRKVCGICGKEGHHFSQCYMRVKSNKKTSVNAVEPQQSSLARCFSCNQLGHFRRNCPNNAFPARQPSQQNDRRCYRCNQRGHLQRNCDQQRDQNYQRYPSGNQYRTPKSGNEQGVRY